MAPWSAERRTLDEPVLTFGRFRLLRAQRLLLSDGPPAHLRGREFELLIALIDGGGAFISKEELIAKVWPNSTVSEANLRVQIAALRRLLGDVRGDGRYILNVPGRGYAFREPVEVSYAPIAAETGADAAPNARRAGVSHESATGLPTRLTRMIGRAETIERLSAHLPHQRLVSIVGAGGIGKTTLALALGESRSSCHPHGVRFIDFAALHDPTLVAAKLSNALGMQTGTDDPTAAAIRFLQDKDILLLFDSCEHVVDAAAALVEAVLKGAPRVHILATSREPLRIDGEWVHRLRPLETPPRSATLLAAEAMAYPAVQLFVERAAASQDTFELVDADANAAGEICRRLDGIPLAIELAAARVDLFGVRGLARRLSDSFTVLRQGRRTAMARHQTLQATLDWSFEILMPRERTVLARLSLFRHNFTLEAACSVARYEGLPEDDIIDAVYELVGKSLIDTDMGAETPLYRLLDATRAYALEKLASDPSRDAIARQHAEYCLIELGKALSAWSDPPSTWLATYGSKIDDVRTAIDWAYSPTGDMRLGLNLTALSAPMASRLAILPEYMGRLHDALARLTTLPNEEPLLELRLRDELFASAMQHNHGDEQAWLVESKNRVALLARAQDDLHVKFDAVATLYGQAFGRADWNEAQDIARQICQLAEQLDDIEARIQGHRMMAQTHHFLGDHDACRTYAEKLLALEHTTASGAYICHRQVDARVGTKIVLARALWIQGSVDEALRVARRSVDLAAESGGHAYCYALAFAAMPVAVWRGDDVFARGVLAMLEEEAARLSLGFWENWASGLSKVLKLRADPRARLIAYWPDFDRPGFPPLQLDECSVLDPRLAVHEAIVRAENGLVSWCAPEVLRSAAETQLKEDRISSAQAEAMLMRALGIARTHNALSWELRAATSLARLWKSQDRAVEAKDQLARVYGRFTEGLETADLVTARKLLAEL